jgi:hypothetical protein
MDLTAILTALVSAGVSAGLGGYIGSRVAVAKLETRVAHIESEIGTRETGLRGAMHYFGNEFPKLTGRVDGLEDRVSSLEEWRKRPRR